MKDNVALSAMVQIMQDNYKLIQRHFIFIALFNQIVSRVGVLNFKSIKKLKNNIANDAIINSILTKIDESFKILFGYFRVDEKTLLSYLQDEEGYRYRLIISEKISLERIKIRATFNRTS